MFFGEYQEIIIIVSMELMEFCLWLAISVRCHFQSSTEKFFYLWQDFTFWPLGNSNLGYLIVGERCSDAGCFLLSVNFWTLYCAWSKLVKEKKTYLIYKKKSMSQQPTGEVLEILSLDLSLSGHEAQDQRLKSRELVVPLCTLLSNWNM
jgi:hypothetical protein